ncbi:MAG: ABC transporter ATP-binding protein [Candidatus Eisenbacteria bacterium]
MVGESGCGKSVTAASVMRLVPSPPGNIIGGEILWKGKNILDVAAKDMPEIRGKEIAMIFQDPMTSLNPVFTVKKQMMEVVERRQGLTGDPAQKRLIEMLNLVGIADPERRLDNYPHELSGGMKQRVMIAMALLAEPDLLIADEPTTALDVTVQAQILHLMKDLQKRLGTAILLITHNMGVVAETCDEVVVMYAGRAVECAPAEELFAANQHPYTRGLLESIPHAGANKSGKLATIEGVVPSLLNPPKGCRFADRCFQAKDRCRSEDPRLSAATNRHEVACHFPLEVGR